MKKFILILIVSVIFIGCRVSSSNNRTEPVASFSDFFNYESIVSNDINDATLEIIEDKNTGVLYVMSYHYGISPIYDSDGTIMTKEKWLAKRTEKKD